MNLRIAFLFFVQLTWFHWLLQRLTTRGSVKKLRSESTLNKSDSQSKEDELSKDPPVTMNEG